MAEDFIAYTFNISAGTGGTVSPSGTRVIQQGESLVVTAYPASGYEFDGFLMLGVKRYDNPITLTGSGSYTGPFNLTATFKQTTVTATKYVYCNGVQQPGLTEQDSGLSPGAAYTPKLHQPSVGAGYALDHILYNGTDVTNSAITCPSNDFGLHYYYVSDAGVWIYNNGWKKAVPWIYSNGWKRATAFIYDGGWKRSG